MCIIFMIFFSSKILAYNGSLPSVMFPDLSDAVWPHIALWILYWYVSPSALEVLLSGSFYCLQPPPPPVLFSVLPRGGGSGREWISVTSICTCPSAPSCIQKSWAPLSPPGSLTDLDATGMKLVWSLLPPSGIHHKVQHTYLTGAMNPGTVKWYPWTISFQWREFISQQTCYISI